MNPEDVPVLPWATKLFKERFTRPESGKIMIDITIDDPGAYSRP
jgi:hypothetical protein